MIGGLGALDEDEPAVAAVRAIQLERGLGGGAGAGEEVEHEGCRVVAGGDFQDSANEAHGFLAVREIDAALAGGREPLTAVRDLADLPAAARRYVDRLAELVGCPVGLLSVGPGREQTIVVENPFRG